MKSLSNFKKNILLLGLGAFFLSGYLFFYVDKNIKRTFQQIHTKAEDIKVDEQSRNESPKVQPRYSNPEAKNFTEEVLLNVPFTIQAPGGKWKKPFFQNGCEEATMVMAMAWTQEKKLTSENAEKEILEVSFWEEKTFGFAVDASVGDVARIIKEYYKYRKVKVLTSISVQDIQREISNEHLVLAQVNGKRLSNPHYTPPGPDEHMLLIIGYDKKSDEFITNDPGTKYGQGYRYKTQILMDAIWSYPTGSIHGLYPGLQKVHKDIISVWK